MRYSRQVMMRNIRESGQVKLANAKVVVVGAGGLGCFVLNELVLAGVGNLKIIDHDDVSITNLNRQFIYREEDLGKSKVELSVKYLKERNSDVNICGVNTLLTQVNVDELLKDADIVVDCVDNVETRLIVNDYCVEHDIPLIEGAINGLYGFVMAIKKEYPCLRCIGYENTKLKGENEALAAAVGMVGSIQALEAIKIIVGMEPLYGEMLMVDCSDYALEKVKLQLSNECHRH